jgi:hypothetical protein
VTIRAMIALALVAACCSACRSTGAPSDTPIPRGPVPTVSQIADPWNARVARLDRLWARTVVTMRYLDAEGDTKSAQGEGHLQRLDWYKVALSAGKVGETLFWFGADQDRYWFFDLSSADRRRVVFGRHDQLTRDKGQLLSIPVPPRQYMRFSGLSAFPTRIEGAVITRTNKTTLQARFSDRAGDWIYDIDERTLHPISITSLDEDGNPEVRSTLSDYRTVLLESPGDAIVQAPGRIVIEHLPSETSITITIDGQMIDGRRAGRPKPAAFDLEGLIEALGPIDEPIDLDDDESIDRLLELEFDPDALPAEQAP